MLVFSRFTFTHPPFSPPCRSRCWRAELLFVLSSLHPPAYTRREKACKGTTFFRHEQLFPPKSYTFLAFFAQKIKIAKPTLQNHPYFSPLTHFFINHLQTFSTAHICFLKLGIYIPVDAIHYFLERGRKCGVPEKVRDFLGCLQCC